MHQEFPIPQSSKELRDQIAFMVSIFYLNISSEKMAIEHGSNRFWNKENNWEYTIIHNNGQLEIVKSEKKSFNNTGEVVYYIKNGLWFGSKDEPTGFDNFTMINRIVDELASFDKM